MKLASLTWFTFVDGQLLKVVSNHYIAITTWTISMDPKPDLRHSKLTVCVTICIVPSEAAAYDHNAGARTSAGQCSANIPRCVSSRSGAKTMPVQYTIFHVTFSVISHKIGLVKHLGFSIWSQLKSFWGIARSPRIRKLVIPCGNIDRIMSLPCLPMISIQIYCTFHQMSWRAFSIKYNKNVIQISKLASEFWKGAFFAQLQKYSYYKSTPIIVHDHRPKGQTSLLLPDNITTKNFNIYHRLSIWIGQ